MRADGRNQRTQRDDADYDEGGPEAHATASGEPRGKFSLNISSFAIRVNENISYLFYE